MNKPKDQSSIEQEQPRLTSGERVRNMCGGAVEAVIAGVALSSEIHPHNLGSFVGDLVLSGIAWSAAKGAAKDVMVAATGTGEPRFGITQPAQTEQQL